LANRAQLGPPPLPDEACKVTPVDADHLFVVAGVMEGDTLTNLQLDDPASTITIVRVKIDPGAQPITIFLQSGNAVIWDFEGAVERVGRAIVASRVRGARTAVRGLPATRAEFRDFSRCPRSVFHPWTVSPESRDENIETYFGRRPVRSVFKSEPNSLAVPQMEFMLTPKKPRGLVIVRKDENGANVSSVIDVNSSGKLFERPIDDSRTDAERNLSMYHPGGFREIEAMSVTSSVAVLTPETFPGEAGLIQLERVGAIRAPRRAEIDAFAGGSGQRVGFDYVVTREIMLPPGLLGAHALKFLVLPGVPSPRGDAGHSCVALMDGYRMNGTSCPRL
jgi:hypothetical protein